MTRLLLGGGWGYNNLGDEAILAGYIGTLADMQVPMSVTSVDPSRTTLAQMIDVPVIREGDASGVFDGLLLGGGGYVNGSWRPEATRKLGRLMRDGRGTVVGAHGIEVRSAQGRFGSKVARVLREGRVAVRDVESKDELSKIGVNSEVLPDGIALLSESADRYLKVIPELKGLVCLNLLDLGARPDRAESEIDPSSYERLSAELVDRLGDRAVGLIIGDGDYEFMRRFDNLKLVAPRTVRELVSILASVSGLFSVRMHPALIATMIGTPVVAVPYCGKVRPTAREIGVTSALLSGASTEDVLDQLASPLADFSDHWETANRRNRRWLEEFVSSLG